MRASDPVGFILNKTDYNYLFSFIFLGKLVFTFPWKKLKMRRDLSDSLTTP